MTFKQYNRPGRKKKNIVPYATINKYGILRFNKACINKWNKLFTDYGHLYFDKDENLLAVKSVDKKGDNIPKDSYKLNRLTDSVSLSIKDFLSDNNINIHKTKKYPVSSNEDVNAPCISLNEGKVVKRKYKKHVNK